MVLPLPVAAAAAVASNSTPGTDNTTAHVGIEKDTVLPQTHTRSHVSPVEVAAAAVVGGSSGCCVVSVHSHPCFQHFPSQNLKVETLIRITEA